MAMSVGAIVPSGWRRRPLRRRRVGDGMGLECGIWEGRVKSIFAQQVLEIGFLKETRFLLGHPISSGSLLLGNCDLCVSFFG
jgi:hypothetical protein